jgi:hypothetical protein
MNHRHHHRCSARSPGGLLPAIVGWRKGGDASLSALHYLHQVLKSIHPADLRVFWIQGDPQTLLLRAQSGRNVSFPHVEIPIILPHLV